MADPCALENGSNIAVVGGGPTGSFFSIFALKMAKMIGKEIAVTIFEPKDFEGNICHGLHTWQEHRSKYSARIS